VLRNFASSSLGSKAGLLGLLTHRAPSSILGLEEGSLLSLLVDDLCLAAGLNLLREADVRTPSPIEESKRRIERRRRLWSSEYL
jgi:hypothetical protein